MTVCCVCTVTVCCVCVLHHTARCVVLIGVRFWRVVVWCPNWGFICIQIGHISYLQVLHNSTDKPVIVTEFGQACCPTDGPCEGCPAFTRDGKTMG